MTTEFLADIQKEFQSYLQDNDEMAILNNIVDTETIDAKERLSIYANAYRMRLQEFLYEDYPKLHTLLGDRAFEILTLDYIKAKPSQYTSARYFGKHMSEFLNESPQYNHQPLLAEMARFEWVLGETLDAADGPLLTQQDLMEIPQEHWPYITFKFHPSVRTNSFEWNVPRIWQIIESNGEAEEPQVYPKPTMSLFWRKDLNCWFYTPDEAEACIYTTIQKGGHFAEICEALCEFLDETTVPQKAMQTLQKWCNETILSSYSDNG